MSEISQLIRQGSDRVMVVVAHPDDEVVGCLALIAGFASAGATVSLCIAHNGNQERIEVSRDIADSHGVSLLLPLKDIFDHALDLSRELVATLDGWMDQIQPSIVVSHGEYDGDHQDHQLLGKAVTISWLRYMVRCQLECRLLRMCPIPTGIGFRATSYFIADDSIPAKLDALARMSAKLDRWYLGQDVNIAHMAANARLIGVQGFNHAELFEEEKRGSSFRVCR